MVVATAAALGVCVATLSGAAVAAMQAAHHEEHHQRTGQDQEEKKAAHRKLLSRRIDLRIEPAGEDLAKPVCRFCADSSQQERTRVLETSARVAGRTRAASPLGWAFRFGGK